MGENETWDSPDALISKVVVQKGVWGPKPTEGCECNVFISDLSGGTVDIERYNNASVVIGDIDTSFGRLLEKCLLTMHSDETSQVKLSLDEEIKFTLHLRSFKTNGAIHEWSALKKHDMALHHKIRGVELFNSNISDASHHFCKGLKLLASIPIEVDVPPTSKDGIEVSEIDKLRINLYNNLASCYLKVRSYSDVIYLCQKVLEQDTENEKALYKIGVAFNEVREFDQAYGALKQLLDIDPDNKPAIDKLKVVKVRLDEDNEKSKEMARKMFGIFQKPTQN